MDKKTKKIREKIKSQLWRMGHKVREMNDIPGINYDLLVDEKIRLVIYTGNKNVDCDVFADIIDGEKRYAVKSDKLMWQRFVRVFGQKK